MKGGGITRICVHPTAESPSSWALCGLRSLHLSHGHLHLGHQSGSVTHTHTHTEREREREREVTHMHRESEGKLLHLAHKCTHMSQVSTVPNIQRPSLIASWTYRKGSISRDEHEEEETCWLCTCRNGLSYIPRAHSEWAILALWHWNRWTEANHKWILTDL